MFKKHIGSQFGDGKMYQDRYFKCNMGHGVFVSLKSIKLEEKKKYEAIQCQRSPPETNSKAAADEKLEIGNQVTYTNPESVTRV